MTLLRLVAGTLCLLYPLADCYIRRRFGDTSPRCIRAGRLAALLLWVVAVMHDAMDDTTAGRPGTPGDPEVLGILSAPAVWAAYRQHLLAHGGPRKRQIRPLTITAYHGILWDFFTWLSCPWWKATPKHLARYLDRPVQPPHPNAGQPLSAATRANRSVVIITFYRLAARKRWGPKAATWADVRPDPQPEPSVRALDLDDIAALLRALVEDRRDRVAAALGYYTMLRVGEMARLRVEDVDLRARPPVMRVDGKGGKERWMPIPAPLAKMLREYMATRPPSGPLLENRKRPGQHLSPHSVSRLLGEAMRSVGVDASAHALRHSGATELMEATDGNASAVQEALGHEALTSTQRYIKRWRRQLGKYLELLPDPLAPPAAQAAAPEGG